MIILQLCNSTNLFRWRREKRGGGKLLLELLYTMDADTYRPGRLPIAIERGCTRLPACANYFFNYKKIRTSLTQQDNYKKIEVKKLKVLIDSRKKKS
jgi:hypothetical protein